MKKETIDIKRKSNIELLRIISMIFIILSHYSIHGGLININEISINKGVGILLFLLR